MRRDAGSRRKRQILAALVTLWGCSGAVHAGPPGPTEEWVTLSFLVPAPDLHRGIGETQFDVTAPDCAAGTEFLVLAVAGGPSLSTVQQLALASRIGGWVVYARIAQRTSSSVAQLEQRLTALGSGAAYVSSTLPAGQPASPPPSSNKVRVGVQLLPDASAPSSYPSRFRIDITGACGTFSVR